MVSDTPADEFQSADQEDSKQLFKKYKASDNKKKDISDINCSESDDAEIINSKKKGQKSTQLADESDDQRAYSPIGSKATKKMQKDQLAVLDYDQMSSMSEGQQEEAKGKTRKASGSSNAKE